METILELDNEVTLAINFNTLLHNIESYCFTWCTKDILRKDTTAWGKYLEELPPRVQDEVNARIRDLPPALGSSQIVEMYIYAILTNRIFHNIEDYSSPRDITWPKDLMVKDFWICDQKTARDIASTERSLKRNGK